MNSNKITLQETMQLHQLLNEKNIRVIKAKLVQGLVFDQDLRALLEKEVQHSYHTISSFTNLLLKAKESLREGKI
jgi:similar to spore coat protein